jgi:hypothetical protein
MNDRGIASLVTAARAGLHTGTPDIERLYELGKKRQWNASELPWESLDFTAVPLPMRAGLAELLTQTHYGELGALTVSAKLVQTSPNLVDRLFGATQVTDEARHVEWFSRLLYHLDTPAPMNAAVAAFIDSVVNVKDDLAQLVGMNILIEGLAQTLMVESGRLLQSIEIEGFESLPKVGTWLVERIAHDESRHLAFGVTRVRQLVDCLGTHPKRELQQQVGRWAAELFALTNQNSVGVVAFGLDGDALMARCLRDARSRLALAGLTLEAA